MVKLRWPHITETAFCCWLQIPFIKGSTIQNSIFMSIIRIPESSLKIMHRWSSKNPRRIPQKQKRKISTYSCVSHHHGRCPLPPLFLARPRYSTASRCSAVQVRTGLRRGNSSRHFPVSLVNQRPPPQSHHHSIITLFMKMLQALASVLELRKHIHLTKIFATRNASVRRTGKKKPYCASRVVRHIQHSAVFQGHGTVKSWGRQTSLGSRLPQHTHFCAYVKRSSRYRERGTRSARAAAHGC